MKTILTKILYREWKGQGKSTSCGEQERPTQQLQKQIDVNKLQRQKQQNIAENHNRSKKIVQVIRIICTVYEGRVLTLKV